MDLMPVRFYGGFEDLTEGGQIHVFLLKNQLIGNSSSSETNSLSNLAKLIGNSSSEKQIYL